MKEEKLVRKSAEKGKYFISKLKEINNPVIRELEVKG
jgi:acetylornithine/succinyldiaminopimelate/putrescine aminotransferase